MQGEYGLNAVCKSIYCEDSFKFWFIIIFIFPYRWNKYLPRSFFSSPLPVSIDTLGN